MRAAVAAVFPCLCSSSHTPLIDGPTRPPGATKGHHCEEMALQSAGDHSSSVGVFFLLSPGSLSPACPSSPLLFTHRQLSQFPNVVIHSNILCSWVFFVVFLFLSFSPSLSPSCGFSPWVRRLRLGVEGREEENPGGLEGVTFAAL